MAVPVCCDLIAVIDAWAYDLHVCLGISNHDPAWTITLAFLYLVPGKAPDHNSELIRIRVEYPSILFCILLCP